MHFPITEPVRGRVAQVYSQSNDPGAASLLGIPPELRNQIYEYLLVNYEPITMVNEVGDDDDTTSRVSNFVGSSAIILTCRQIYHEALGILYGQNVFRFQYSVQYQKYFVFLITSPVETCTKWVEDIGSCLSGLRTVTIDISVPKLHGDYHEFERDSYQNTQDHMPILRLLDIIWNDIASNISIKFEHTHETGRYVRFPVDIASEVLDVKCEGITNILYELGKMDCLGLKGTRRLLREVYVDASGIRGTIIYWGTGHRTGPCREFQLLGDTRMYELVPLPSPWSLLDLPDEIIMDIACLALPNHDITYNFDTGITHGHGFGLLNVNKQLRRMVRSCFLSRARFTLILGSDTWQPAKTLYEVLEPRIAESFEDAYNHNRHMRYCTPIEAAQDHENEPTIILQFQTANHIQINAWDLLWTTTIFPPGTTIMIRVRDCSDNVHVTTLGEIRRYALVFLEDLMDKAIPQSWCATVEFWLNEQCLPVRATIQENDQGSEYPDLDVVDISNMMDITALRKAVDAREWRPYGELRGFKGITRPRSWDYMVFCDLVKCLRSLCL
jgi:hypothetical protein